MNFFKNINFLNKFHQYLKKCFRKIHSYLSTNRDCLLNFNVGQCPEMPAYAEDRVGDIKHLCTVAMLAVQLTGPNKLNANVRMAYSHVYACITKVRSIPFSLKKVHIKSLNICRLVK